MNVTRRVLTGIVLLSLASLVLAADGQPASTLLLTNWTKGDIEWVVIQKGTSEEDKYASCEGTGITYGDKTATVPLTYINSTRRFTDSGSFIVVVKPKNDTKMYINLGVRFKDGSGSARWGAWIGMKADE